ncbi:MAG: hypothetical protein PHP64_00870 [Actinomycetota bacterium]|nr:hypothetical protein [Actinomycetota bacterium]
MKRGARFRWWKILIVIIFAALVFTAASKHEAFTDEGQAWLIARDAPVGEIFFKWLHYEGHPSLWFALLIIPAKLGLPFYSINIISALIATISVFLFLMYSPLPSFMNVLFAFSYFVSYQYAVVARNYVLALLLLIVLAIFYQNRFSKPYSFFLILALLANVSLHCTLIAIGISVNYLLELKKRWLRFDRDRKRRIAFSMLFFVCVLLLLPFQLWPRSDNRLMGGFDFSPARFASTGNFLISGTGPFSNYLPVTVICLLVIAIWFWKRGNLFLYLFPSFLHFLLVAIKPISVFNHGIFFIYLVFVVWVSYEGTERERLFSFSIRNLSILALSVLLVIQVFWGFQAIAYDYSHSYSGALEVSNFIKSNNLDKTKIYMVGESCTGVLPYFKENIFSNMNEGGKPCFWDYSKKNKTPERLDKSALESIRKDKPDIVVLSLSAVSKKKEKQNLKSLLREYHPVGPFTGFIIWKEQRGPHETYSYFVLLSKDKFVMHK